MLIRISVKCECLYINYNMACEKKNYGNMVIFSTTPHRQGDTSVDIEQIYILYIYIEHYDSENVKFLF